MFKADLGYVATAPVEPVQPTDAIRLHVGGKERRKGWKILNIQPGPEVDFVGDCTDLSHFPDNSIAEIYASHVYEHLGYQKELPKAIASVYRVLRPGGIFRVGVPDLDTLCKLFVHPTLTLNDKIHVMRMIYGGQMDSYDFHKVGLSFELFGSYLHRAGFKRIKRVDQFGLFKDCSTIVFATVCISLNIEATK